MARSSLSGHPEAAARAPLGGTPRALGDRRVAHCVVHAVASAPAVCEFFVRRRERRARLWRDAFASRVGVPAWRLCEHRGLRGVGSLGGWDDDRRGGGLRSAEPRGAERLRGAAALGVTIETKWSPW